MKPLRNLRVAIAVEHRGLWLTDERTLALPVGHVREGESLWYALARVARDICGAQVRVHDIAAVAERDGRRPSDRCIDIYIRASLVGEYRAGRWRTLEELRQSGLEAEVIAALAGHAGAPYLGNVRESRAGIGQNA